jgi:hypothetical protein
MRASAADGNVYVYDLATRQRLIRPVAQLQVGSSSSNAQGHHSRDRRSQGSLPGVNALAYNTVVPSTLAAAAGDQVKVCARQSVQERVLLKVHFGQTC